MSDKDVEAFLKDRPTISHLVARTGEIAREEIKGKADQFILYYEDGILLVEDGLGNIKPFRKDKFDER